MCRLALPALLFVLPPTVHRLSLLPLNNARGLSPSFPLHLLRAVLSGSGSSSVSLHVASFAATISGYFVSSQVVQQSTLAPTVLLLNTILDYSTSLQSYLADTIKHTSQTFSEINLNGARYAHRGHEKMAAPLCGPGSISYLFGDLINAVSHLTSHERQTIFRFQSTP